MSGSVYLHKDDLVTMLQFLDAFPESSQLELTYDNSSGIGTTIEVHIHGINFNGQIVTIKRTIVNEADW